MTKKVLCLYRDHPELAQIVCASQEQQEDFKREAKAAMDAMTEILRSSRLCSIDNWECIDRYVSDHQLIPAGCTIDNLNMHMGEIDDALCWSKIEGRQKTRDEQRADARAMEFDVGPRIEKNEFLDILRAAIK